MSKSITQKSPFKLLYFVALSGSVLWSAVILLSLAWSVHVERRQLMTLVENEARAHFNKDQAFRFWSASHGGVYVPTTEATPPNPDLSHIQERDIVTPSGKQLTLMNPAYMLRQLMTQYEKLYGVKGRITSLQTFNPLNTPDEWERTALHAFEKGSKEALEYTEIEGEPYLRLMRPMVTKRGCLKCHGHQGYQEGDIRGGVGIALPLTSHQEVSRKTVRHIYFAYFLLWFAMLPVIFLLFKKAQSRLKERMSNENKMKKWFRIFRHAQWGIMVSDDEISTLDTMNPAFAEIHGFTVDELRDKPYLSLVDEDFRDDTVRQFITAKKNGHHIFESRHIHKDGTCFPVELNVTAVRAS
ncbi:MAG: DUF3365 domain-containing protein, partial [Candidatus Electrothrix sp. AR4]|nr:DUF3365 domain-containing protein [Candidatus Electrothrix sp. AR4]